MVCTRNIAFPKKISAYTAPISDGEIDETS